MPETKRPPENPARFREKRQAFHEASPRERLEIAKSFEDPRLAVFGRRLVHAGHRGSLPEAERFREDLDLANRLLDARAGPLTLPEAISELDELVANGEYGSSALLEDYRRWLVAKVERVERFRAAHDNRT